MRKSNLPLAGSKLKPPQSTSVLRPSSVTTPPGAVHEPADLTVGEKVLISGERPGVLRYLGAVHFAEGLWCGIELLDASGKNDGEVKGTRYFSCADQHGVFAAVHKVRKDGCNKESPVLSPNEFIPEHRISNPVSTKVLDGTFDAGPGTSVNDQTFDAEDKENQALNSSMIRRGTYTLDQTHESPLLQKPDSTFTAGLDETAPTGLTVLNGTYEAGPTHSAYAEPMHTATTGTDEGPDSMDVQESITPYTHNGTYDAARPDAGNTSAGLMHQQQLVTADQCNIMDESFGAIAIPETPAVNSGRSLVTSTPAPPVPALMMDSPVLNPGQGQVIRQDSGELSFTEQLALEAEAMAAQFAALGSATDNHTSTPDGHQDVVLNSADRSLLAREAQALAAEFAAMTEDDQGNVTAGIADAAYADQSRLSAVAEMMVVSSDSLTEPMSMSVDSTSGAVTPMSPRSTSQLSPSHTPMSPRHDQRQSPRTDENIALLNTTQTMDEQLNYTQTLPGNADTTQTMHTNALNTTATLPDTTDPLNSTQTISSAHGEVLNSTQTIASVSAEGVLNSTQTLSSPADGVLNSTQTLPSAPVDGLNSTQVLVTDCVDTTLPIGESSPMKSIEEENKMPVSNKDHVTKSPDLVTACGPPVTSQTSGGSKITAKHVEMTPSNRRKTLASITNQKPKETRSQLLRKSLAPAPVPRVGKAQVEKPAPPPKVIQKLKPKSKWADISKQLEQSKAKPTPAAKTSQSKLVASALKRSEDRRSSVSSDVSQVSSKGGSDDRPTDGVKKPMKRQSLLPSSQSKQGSEFKKPRASLLPPPVNSTSKQVKRSASEAAKVKKQSNHHADSSGIWDIMGGDGSVSRQTRGDGSGSRQTRIPSSTVNKQMSFDEAVQQQLSKRQSNSFKAPSEQKGKTLIRPPVTSVTSSSAPPPDVVSSNLTSRRATSLRSPTKDDTKSKVAVGHKKQLEQTQKSLTEKDEWVKGLREELSNSAKSVEVFGVIVQQLTSQLEKANNDLVKSRAREVELSQSHEEEVERLNTSHTHSAQLLSTNHEEEKQMVIKKLNDQFDKEFTKVTGRHTTEMEELKMRLSGEHEAVVNGMNENHTEAKQKFESDITGLKRECEKLQAQYKQAQSALERDSDTRLQIALAPYKLLPQEIESLKAVIDMKSEESKDLRIQSNELRRKLDVIPELNQKIYDQNQKIENLEALIQIVTQKEKDTAEKYHALSRKAAKDTKEKHRLSLNCEALAFKLEEAEWTMEQSDMDISSASLPPLSTASPINSPTHQNFTRSLSGRSSMKRRSMREKANNEIPENRSAGSKTSLSRSTSTSPSPLARGSTSRSPPKKTSAPPVTTTPMMSRSATLPRNYKRPNLNKTQ